MSKELTQRKRGYWQKRRIIALLTAIVMLLSMVNLAATLLVPYEDAPEVEEVREILFEEAVEEPEVEEAPEVAEIETPEVVETPEVEEVLDNDYDIVAALLDEEFEEIAPMSGVFGLNAFNNGNSENESLRNGGNIRIWTQLNGANALVTYANLDVAATLPNGDCALHFVNVNRIWNNLDYVNLLDVSKRGANEGPIEPWHWINLTVTYNGETVELRLFNNYRDFGLHLFNNGPGGTPSTANVTLANAGTIRIWTQIDGANAQLPNNSITVSAVDQDGADAIGHVTVNVIPWYNPTYIQTIDVNKHAPWERIYMTVTHMDQTIELELVNSRFFSLEIFNNGPGGTQYPRPNANLAAGGTIRMWTQLMRANALVPYAQLTVTAQLPNGNCAMEFITINRIWNNLDYVNFIDANTNAPWQRIYLTATLFGQTVDVVLVNGNPQVFGLHIFNNGPSGDQYPRPNASLALGGTIRMWTQLDGANALIPYDWMSVSAVDQDGVDAMEFINVNNMFANPGNVNLIDANKHAPWQVIYLTVTVLDQELTVRLVNSTFSLDIFNNGPLGDPLGTANESLAEAGLIRMWTQVNGVGAPVSRAVVLPTIEATFQDSGECALHLFTFHAAAGNANTIVSIDVNKNADWEFINFEITAFGQTLEILLHNALFCPCDDVCPDCGECQDCSECLVFRWDVFNNGEGTDPDAYPSRGNPGLANSGTIRMWTGFGDRSPGTNQPIPQAIGDTITAVDQDGNCAMAFVTINRTPWQTEAYMNFVDVDKNANWQYITLTITICGNEYEAVLWNANFVEEVAKIVSVLPNPAVVERGNTVDIVVTTENMPDGAWIYLHVDWLTGVGYEGGSRFQVVDNQVVITITTDNTAPLGSHGISVTAREEGQWGQTPIICSYGFTLEIIEPTFYIVEDEVWICNTSRHVSVFARGTATGDITTDFVSDPDFGITIRMGTLWTPEGMVDGLVVGIHGLHAVTEERTEVVNVTRGGITVQLTIHLYPCADYIVGWNAGSSDAVWPDGQETSMRTAWDGVNLLPTQDPIRPGYIFQGWQLVFNGTLPMLADGPMVTADCAFRDLAANRDVSGIMLVAQWEAIPPCCEDVCEVCFEPCDTECELGCQGYGECGEPCVCECPVVNVINIYFFPGENGTGTMATVPWPAGTEFTLPANGFTAPAGYEFYGWFVAGYSDPLGALQPSDVITAGLAAWPNTNVNVTAVWVLIVEPPCCDDVCIECFEPCDTDCEEGCKGYGNCDEPCVCECPCCDDVCIECFEPCDTDCEEGCKGYGNCGEPCVCECPELCEVCNHDPCFCCEDCRRYPCICAYLRINVHLGVRHYRS